ncbi:MAG TPA: GWxTD domain-containing protein [Candidatus Aminicenantes bacterium]|nr:GWxTD domain-containing protein [Candidatus Aminicenantes bacterium]
MKRYAVWSIVFLALFAFLYTAPAGAAKKKEADKYENWMKEEVKLLITSEEESAFKKLKTDEEKDKFIALFWAKRDPSPLDKANEFKDEWYARLEYVNKTYSKGSIAKGWHTDMGRVYMIFGPPAQVRGGGSGQVRPESAGGSQIMGPPETWVYQPMPALGLNSEFTVTFLNQQFGYDLDEMTPQPVRHALDIFSKVVIFNPDLKELPMYKFSLDESSAEAKLINEFIAGGQEINQIPLEWTPIYTRAMSGSTYVSFLVRIDAQNLDRKKLREMTFFGRLQGEGEEVQEFLQPLKLDQDKSDKMLAVFGFPAKAGKSVLYLGAEDKDKELHTLVKADLDVQNFWNDELNTSSLILSSQVISKPREEAGAEFSPFVTSDYKATPRWGNAFKPSEFLSVLYQVYNAKTQDGALDLSIDYFIISDEAGYRLNPQTVKTKVEENMAVACGTEVPLSPLKPGKYTFKIRVTDKIAGKNVEKTAPFVVE